MIEALAIHNGLLAKPTPSKAVHLLESDVHQRLGFTLAFIPGLLLDIIYWLARTDYAAGAAACSLWNIVIYRIQSDAAQAT